MSDLAMIGLQLALIVLVLLLVPLAHRIAVGPTQVERLQAIESFTNMLLAILIVLAVLQGVGMYVDVALALAAFSFIATTGIARYIAQGKVF